MPYDLHEYLYKPNGNGNGNGNGSSANVAEPTVSRVNSNSKIQDDRNLSNGTDRLAYAKLEDLKQQVYSLEQAILRAQKPLEVADSETVVVNGERGQWLNKQEVENWRGDLPISRYPINVDNEPDVIRKKPDQHLVYEQEVAIRYLRPPTPAPLGDIILKEGDYVTTPAAPPLVIRQQPARPDTPPPVIIREAPPSQPAPLPPKIVTIPGKKLPPPPRKVVIERLPQLPQKPQSVIIERWLPFKEPVRAVRYEPNRKPLPVVEKTKNIIIQWEAPEVFVKKDYRDLGVIRANPQEYINKYGDALKTPVDLPGFVKEIEAPTGVILAAQYKPSSIPQLIGDVDKLRLVDLDREGLSEYKDLVNRLLERHSSQVFSERSETPVNQPNQQQPQQQQQQLSRQVSELPSRPVSCQPSRQQSRQPSPPVQETPRTFQKNSPFDIAFLNLFLANAFAALDREAGFKISKSEALRAFQTLSTTLGINSSLEELIAFVESFDRNKDGFIDFSEFKRGVVRRFVAHASEFDGNGSQ